MAVIPCSKNENLKRQIEDFAEVLKTQAHLLGDHGLGEKEFYQSGILRGAVERVRGQYSAGRAEKREFVRRVLNHLQDGEHIVDYEEADSAARYDFTVETSKGVFTAIAAKGCLDGNNTNVFERPAGVSEFLIWSICTNPGADPRRNAWSGIHTRLGAEIIERQQLVDGVVIWDWRCGTVGRPCPKILADPSRTTPVGQWLLVPPCIYLMPSDVPGPDTPNPPPSTIDKLPLLRGLHVAFCGGNDELNEVWINYDETMGAASRRTTIKRGGTIEQASEKALLRRR